MFQIPPEPTWSPVDESTLPPVVALLLSIFGCYWQSVLYIADIN